jgi:hypothetical protein
MRLRDRVSSSHALIGGYAGAAVAKAGRGPRAERLLKILVFTCARGRLPLPGLTPDGITL